MPATAGALVAGAYHELSRFSRADLRGARLAAVDGARSLRGTWMDAHQLAVLAPALAAGLGIRVM